MKDIKMGMTAIKWLKVLHVFAACLWGGGAISLVVLLWGVTPTSGAELHMRDLCIKVVDALVIVPGAIVCLITGAGFQFFTPWGKNSHAWLYLKWLINLGFIFAGIFYFVPWLDRAERLSLSLGWSALDNSMYIHSRWLNSCLVISQVAVLLVCVGVSIFKPEFRQKK